jgi:hypothetical protein
MDFYMKHFADKVYFFKNDLIIVTYKLYFLKTYFMIFDNYLSLLSSFKVDVSRFVDMTYLTEQQTDQFFSNLDKTYLREIPHFH